MKAEEKEEVKVEVGERWAAKEKAHSRSSAIFDPPAFLP